MRSRRVLLSLLAASGLLLLQSSAQAGLMTGFDDPSFESRSTPVRQLWLSRAAAEHAGFVRLNLAWGRAVRMTPASAAQAADPSWSGYDFSGIDESIRDASAAGLQVMLTLAGPAPRFAEGPGRPAKALAGTWKPNPDAYAAFAHAVAVRYSGSYTPPGASAPLPYVRYWQAWNEPNLSIYLTPQWVAQGKGYAPASPAAYRPLLNALYGAVKGVDPHALVISAGTAPYGDLPGGTRMPPAQFVRNLICLDETGRRAVGCPERAQFDILDHHPYSIEGPFWRAQNVDDVAIADMGKLTGPLRRAERLHLIGGMRHHQVWATELSWDSNPPDPQGVPAAEHARWLAQSLYVLWREGVSTALWYLIVDSPPIPSYATTYQSGVYLLNGTPKPAASAFRFPLVLRRAGPRKMLLWTQAPASGRLVVERKQGNGWRVLFTASVSDRQVVMRRLRTRRRLTVRARIGGLESLPFSER